MSQLEEDMRQKDSEHEVNQKQKESELKELQRQKDEVFLDYVKTKTGNANYGNLLLITQSEFWKITSNAIQHLLNLLFIFDSKVSGWE